MLKTKNTSFKVFILSLMGFLLSFILFFNFNSYKSYAMSDTLPTLEAELIKNDTFLKLDINVDNVLGYQIWTDGVDLYFSSGSTNYVLTFENGSFVATSVTFTGASSQIFGNYIWSDGNRIISSFYNPLGGSNVSYVFNSLDSSWSTLTFNGSNFVDGSSIVKYNNNYFMFLGSYSLLLNVSTDTWSSVTFTGIPSVVYGYQIWTDGINYYYSFGDSQYIIDFDSMTFSPILWSGLDSFNGVDIWSDGTDYFYSNNTTQYVLDKNTRTWSVKTWQGLSSFDGSNVVNINNGIYVFDSVTDAVWALTGSYYTYGYNSGYNAGYNAGYEAGANSTNNEDIYQNGYQAGYQAGLATQSGYNLGYNTGYDSGYEVGYNAGNSAGYNSGYNAGNSAGYDSGYSAGVESVNQYTFLNLIGAVIDAPIKAFTGLFNFDIFGVNIQNLLLAIFTLAVVVTIIKISLGGK